MKTLSIFSAGALIVALLAVAGCTTNPTIQTSKEPTYDGLYPVKSTRLKQVWALPDADYSGYRKIGLQGLGIHYRPVKNTNARRAMSGGNSEFPIGEKERENLEKMARDIFVEEMAKIKSFEFVDADTNNAADVLYVRAGLLDVVSRVPPEPMGRTDVYLDSVGQATLVIELVDAESDTVLARAIDVRAAGSNTAGPPIRSNSVVNSSEVKRLLRTWSETLRSAIEYLAQDVGAIPTSP